MPAGWTSARLQDLSVGGLTNGVFKQPERAGRGLALVNVADLYGRFGIDLGSVERFAATSVELRRHGLNDGDIFFTRSSLVLSGIAHCNFVREVREAAVFECHVVRLRPDKAKADPTYLALACRSPRARSFFMGRAKQVTMTTISQPDIAPLIVALPPLVEQREIAAILDTIDDAISKTEEIIAKLKQVKQGLLHDLLMRGIDDNGDPRDPERRPEQFKDSPLGRIPKEWEVTTIAALSDAVVDCPHSTPVFTAEGPLVARTSHIKAGRFDVGGASRVSEREYGARIARLEPKPGDVIFTREAPVGEAFVIPQGMRICLGQRVMLLRPDPRRLDPHYLVAQVYSGAVARRIEVLTGGTTNPHLNVAEVRAFRIPAPSVQEQRRLGLALGSADRRLDNESQIVEKLRLAKSGLMDDLLTGRVRVSPIEVSS